MKMSKKSRWILLLVVALVSFLMFFVKINSVQAIFNEAHVFRVYLRVEREIMQTAPFGQYYESLFWKYNDELCRLCMLILSTGKNSRKHC